jgi:hypothetical protein
MSSATSEIAHGITKLIFPEDFQELHVLDHAVGNYFL